MVPTSISCCAGGSPILPNLIAAAVGTHAALVDFAYTEHLTDYGADRISTRALEAAVEDWCFANDAHQSEISDDTWYAARTMLISMGWAARERFQQTNVVEERDIWTGAARHEARLP